MNIRNKLVLGSVLGVLLPVAITSSILGYVGTSVSREALTEQVRNNLISTRNNKQQQIESYISLLSDQTKTFSNDRMIIDAMREFRTAYTELESQPLDDREVRLTSIRDYYQRQFADEYARFNTDESLNLNALINRLDDTSIRLQSEYISDNPNPLGQKDELSIANSQDAYAGVHARYHSHIRDFLKTFGYYDIFLADPVSGDIIYSVYKEIDYSTSLYEGSFASTGIGQIFQRANQPAALVDEVFITDFSPYLPSYEAQAGFLASPIYDGGEKLGVLIVQAPIDRINDIMTSGSNWSQVGLGESGETYLVAEDGTMRNDSRFLLEDREAYLSAVSGLPFATEVNAKNTTIGLQTVDTPGIQAALDGETGFQIFPDYRGVSVLSAYAPLDLPGLNWALMSEIDEAEAFAPAAQIRDFTLISAAAVALSVLILAGFGAFGLVRSILNPLSSLGQTVSRVAGGDTEARSKLTTGDELQDLGDAFDQLLDERISSLVNAERENEQLNDSVVNLLDAVSQLSDRDLTVTVPVSEDVTGAVADAMNLMTQETAKVLNDIRQIADDVANAVENTKSQGDRVDQVAAEERETVKKTSERLDEAVRAMNQIAEVAKSCNELATGALSYTEEAAQSVTQTASGMSEIREMIAETEKRMKRLGERSQEINAAVEIINNIAERTHVLALNASMQAAAAGDAGRGFAVVADEVQRLAESSRESTSQIGALVGNIQAETSETMANMQKTITQVVEGTDLAIKAGEQMSSTRSQTEKLSRAVADIASSSIRQAEASVNLKELASGIDRGARETAEAISIQARQIDRLAQASQSLQQSIDVFRLPTSARSGGAEEPRARLQSV